MKDTRKSTQPQKPLVYVLILGFVVFVNCFGFPVYNLTKEWSFWITVQYLFLVPVCAVAAGGFFASIFPAKSSRFILLLTTALTCAGLGCRFLLEFGEVSNTYNFTAANILLHMLVFVGLTFLAWFSAVQRKRAERSS